MTAGAWFRFFLGTPRRLFITFGGIALIFGLFRPDVIGDAVSGLLNALLQAIAPFVWSFLVLGFVILGIRIMIFGRRPRGGGRDGGGGNRR